MTSGLLTTAYLNGFLAGGPLWILATIGAIQLYRYQRAKVMQRRIEDHTRTLASIQRAGKVVDFDKLRWEPE